jgi:hypothetical protein
MIQTFYSILVMLLFSSCGSLYSDSDPVYEAAIRYYIESWSTSPDTVVITIEGEAPSESLLNSLSDLDVYLTGKEDVNRLDTTNMEPGSYRDLSVRNVRWRGTNRVLLEVSFSSTTPDGYTDAHGVEYLMEKKEGEWVVVHVGVEWMT